MGTLTLNAGPKQMVKCKCVETKRHFISKGNLLGNFLLCSVHKILIKREGKTTETQPVSLVFCWFYRLHFANFLKAKKPSKTKINEENA